MTKLLDIYTPKEIEQKSFEIIEAETIELYGTLPFSDEKWQVARRIVHTSADFGILKDLCFSENAIASAKNAIKNNAIVYTDTNMAKCGITSLAKDRVKCLLELEGVSDYATKNNTTRSYAAINLLGEKMNNAIIAVGNAPTSILALLEIMQKFNYRPALVIGMAVGFVNAAESKELLSQFDCEYIILKGRKGGSNLVAAAVNALVKLDK